MRGKITVLQEALTSHFDDHHALICRMTLSTIDSLNMQIEELTASIEVAIEPFAARIEQLDEVSGIGRICAQDVIAEIALGRRGRPEDVANVHAFLVSPERTTSPGHGAVTGGQFGGMG
jgi:transposase